MSRPQVFWTNASVLRFAGGSDPFAHIVNDKTPTWGGGFAREVRKTWSSVQEDFQRWVAADPGRLHLGSSHFTPVSESIGVFHMVAQHGYGTSTKPRIRYAALRTCLNQLADLASTEHASVHMPRIGAGQAGGNWYVIAELIDEALLAQGLRVTVYDLPWAEVPAAEQLVLGLRA